MGGNCQIAKWFDCKVAEWQSGKVAEWQSEVVEVASIYLAIWQFPSAFAAHEPCYGL
jgi:hypothetical protein